MTFTPTIQEKIADALDDRIFNLIILPTEKCNFRCFYCYENFKVDQMGEDVVTGIKSLLDKRMPELSSLEISWFGGEPLLAKPIVYDISSHIVTRQKRYPKLKYKANMTTNGYLLDINTLTRLVDLGINDYQITLDGDIDIHDKIRVTANDRGTFDKIWSNLLAIRDSKLEVKIVLRLHYTPQTWNDLNPLINKINNTFSDDLRFQIYFKSVSRLGGPNDELIDIFQEKRKYEIKEELENRLRNPKQVMESEDNYICYASKPNSIVIRANGDLAKCTVALYDTQNMIGRLKENGELIIHKEKLSYWFNGLETMDKSLLACPYKVQPTNKNMSLLSINKNKHRNFNKAIEN